MAQQQVTQIGNTAALFLPPDILEQTGIHVGDTIEMSVVDGMLIVSSLQEIEREQRIQTLSATSLHVARVHINGWHNPGNSSRDDNLGQQRQKSF